MNYVELQRAAWAGYVRHCLDFLQMEMSCVLNSAFIHQCTWIFLSPPLTVLFVGYCMDGFTTHINRSLLTLYTPSLSSAGFDRDIFSGSPSLQHLIDTYQPKLSPEEQSFLDNQVHHLCTLLNDHEVVTKKDFSKQAWDYMRDEKFFGMKIPKEWGGLGFSTHAVSSVLAKLATQCFDANATVAVPNSLGPGELLVRYGTPEQKEYFLPRLANGTLIPCFGLTGPHSGSDATSLIGSDCVVKKHPRTGELGVVASFKKRYITLAPVAGCVGLGLNLTDPEGLLNGVGEEGFTVALLE